VWLQTSRKKRKHTRIPVAVHLEWVEWTINLSLFIFTKPFTSVRGFFYFY
jgi:hypothetical protein